MRVAAPGAMGVAGADVASGGTVDADPGSNSFLVRGHARSQPLYSSAASDVYKGQGQEPVTKAYPIRVGDPAAISASLTAAFTSSRDYIRQYQEAN